MGPKEVIQGIFDAFSRGDIPFILSQVAPGAVWRQSPLVPWGGEFRGPDGAGEFFTKLDEAMETTAFRVDEVVESGEDVFSFGYYGGKGRSSGKTGGTPWAFRWRVRDGKVVLYDAYVDTAALLRAL